MTKDSNNLFRLYTEAASKLSFSHDEGKGFNPILQAGSVPKPEHDEADMTNPEEREEVEIFKAMLQEIYHSQGSVLNLNKGSGAALLSMVEKLLKMHGQSTTYDPDAMEKEEQSYTDPNF